MTDAQTWTLIVGFLSAIFALLAVVSTMFVHVLKSEIGALETRLTSKIDALDRDVQAIARHLFGEPG